MSFAFNEKSIGMEVAASHNPLSGERSMSDILDGIALADIAKHMSNKSTISHDTPDLAGYQPCRSSDTAKSYS